MTAEEHIKKNFPDWKDWPEWSVQAQVKVMQDYAKEVADDALDDCVRIASRFIYSGAEYEKFQEAAENIEIITP